MSTVKIIADEFGAFEDEVLDAGWLPPIPELQVASQKSGIGREAEPDIDADTFLNEVYRNQA